MSFIVIIPARYASTRLPGKPLALIGDKPMIQHVYERALEAKASRVIVATDDERIKEVVEAFSGEVCLTSEDHLSGSDRLTEVCNSLKLDSSEIIVNVQGDEPFISPDNIEQVANNLSQNTNNAMATLSTPILDEEEVFNPNVVKVVSNNHSQALYFSRAPIAWQRGHFETKNVKDFSHCQRHIGIYAYRVEFLKQFVSMPESSLEALESLEQLRALENGFNIHIEQAKDVPGMGIDTAEDLIMAQRAYEELSN